MKIFIHKDIFENISEFKLICEYILNDIKLEDFVIMEKSDGIYIDKKSNDCLKYNHNNYIELDSSNISNQYNFTLSIERGIYPN